MGQFALGIFSWHSLPSGFLLGQPEQFAQELGQLKQFAQALKQPEEFAWVLVQPEQYTEAS